jgi:hypothetical protein
MTKHKAGVSHFGWTLLADAIAKLSKASGITKQEAAQHIVTAARDGALYTRGRLHHARGHSIAISPAAWEGMDPDPVMSRLCPPNPGLEVQEPFQGAPVVCEVEIHTVSLEAWKAGEARPPVPIMQPITMPSALRHSVLVWRELHFAADTKMAGIIDELWPSATSAAAPARKSKKAMQALRPKGNPGIKTERITAEMRKMDPTELRAKKLKELAALFSAAQSTCRKARNTALE